MRRLPPWVVLGMAVLTVLMLVAGWDERHHAGPAPFVLGVLWAVFTLAAAGAMFKPQDH